MQPRILKSDATDLTHLGYGVITTAISCKVTEELQQAPVLEMQLLVSDPMLQYIAVGNIIAARPNKNDDIQGFVIEEITKPIDGVISIYAPHVAQHRAKLLPFPPVSGYTTLDAALHYLSAGGLEDNPFTLQRDTGKNNVTATFQTTEPHSLRDLMGGMEGSIIDIYRGEWGYNNYTLTLYNRRGRDNGARVLYGRNMTNFELDERFNWTTSPTGAVGFATFENENGIEETVYSDPQYSQLADNYPYKKTVVVDFSADYEGYISISQEEINRHTREWIQGRGAIAATVDIAYNQIDNLGGEDVGLGDTIHIYNGVYNYETTSRVVAIEYDVLAEEYTSVTIGEQRTTLNEAIADIGGGSTSSGGGGGGSSVDPSTTLPIMDGTASVGTEQTYARGDHRHPSDTTRVAKSGDTMTGSLIVKSSNIDITTNPSANRNSRSIEWADANGVNLGLMQIGHNADGNMRFMIGAHRNVNGSDIYNLLSLYVTTSGERVIGFSEVVPWQKGLGLYPSVVTPTLIATSNFSLVQSAIYKMGKFVYGSIILRCTSAWSSGEIINLNNTLPAYVFSLCAVTNGQWDYAINKVVRAYFPASGRITINTSISSGQYVTIPIAITVN